jgi:hypothetical protein
VSYGGLAWIAVGSGSVAAVSTTGTSFATQPLPASADWSAVVYSGKHWVALARNTTATAYTAPGTWTAGSIGSSANWSWAGFGGDRFYALSENSSIAISDGKSANQITFNLQPADQIAAENSTVTFAIDSQNATPTTTYQWQRSTDGTSWTNIGVPSTAKFVSFTATLALNQTLYRCQALSSSIVAATSSIASLSVVADIADKPIAWASRATLAGDRLWPRGTLDPVAGEENHWFNYRPVNGRIITAKGASQDGVNWTAHVGMPDPWATAPNTAEVFASGIYFFNNRYFIGRGFARNGADTAEVNKPKSIVSADGRNWTATGVNDAAFPGEVIASPASGLRYSGPYRFHQPPARLQTLDGTTSTAITNTDFPDAGSWAYFYETIGNIRVIGIKNKASSAAAVPTTWVYVNGVFKQIFNGIVIGFQRGLRAGEDSYVVFTETGKWISEDGGASWFLEQNSVGYSGYCPTYGNGMWVMPAKGTTGVYYTSIDLKTWYTYTNLPGTAMGPAIFWGNKFLIPIGTPGSGADNAITGFAVSP